MTDLTTANTILAQLGGSRRLGIAIGAYGFTGSANSLSFRFKARAGNGSNALVVALDASDTYTVEFVSLRGANRKVKRSLSFVYADQLVPLFEKETGLYLTLFPRKAA